MMVADGAILGYLWSENVGWINLSCRNNNTCVKADYGVKNDGNGKLSGYGWGENIGWVNFKPTGSGVTIDPNTGVFNGKAWGENIGWLSFNGSDPGSFQLKTTWKKPLSPNGNQNEGGPLVGGEADAPSEGAQGQPAPLKNENTEISNGSGNKKVTSSSSCALSPFAGGSLLWVGILGFPAILFSVLRKVVLPNH